MSASPTISLLADELAAGRASARSLAESCLARIRDVHGEGRRAFVQVDADAVLDAADAIDLLRRSGNAPSRFAGIPISVKDLFDVQGQVTRAGSVILSDSTAARDDAEVVRRLRRMGFILIGRTNMTEFAYSGLGINPHYGTPCNPWRRQERRVPGGSSSGAAVSVADEMAHGALGTDTGGSCRIPAAFNSLVGYKPTARRVPLTGVVPLSPTLDSVGPIARSVSCCATLDAILAGEESVSLPAGTLRGLRLAVPRNVALDALDAEVARVFEAMLGRLSGAGALVENIDVPEFDEVASINSKGGFTAAESYAWHRDLIRARHDGYDPRVASRIIRGREQSAADYIGLLAARSSLIRRIDLRIDGYGALLMPTVPIVPPRIADLDADDAFARVNLLVLRNPTLVNMFDGCAVSVPINRVGDAPVGLMLAGEAGSDRRILAIAASVESLVRRGASS
ncbi:amidase [Bradyrhizobium liaoningense]